MNLRSQIHAAIEEVAPPAPALQRDVLEFVFSESKQRTNRAVSRPSPWSWGMRRAGSLVAIGLTMLLLATLLVGGRLWRDWNAQQQSLAVHAKVAQLRDRPLHLPSVAAGDVCPESQYNLDQGVYPAGYGVGPIYAKGSGIRYVTNSRTYFDTSYRPDPDVSGLVLIRGQDLVTNQSMVFGIAPYGGNQNPVTPSGKEVGSDTLIGRTVHLHSEVLMDMAQYSVPGYGWEMIQGFPKGSSGCIGFQADGFRTDGSPFSEVIVISFLIAP
ncbi:MAG TPA: hypothetical protein VGS16_09115 [Candidatus Dormibacteraeota bacterium]|nr:hypothetical protein [Candidatus Dormibacteraeota bacterium]